MMGFFTWWKPVVFGLLVFAIMGFGWQVANWKYRSDQLENSQANYKALLQKNIQSDADRLHAEKQLVIEQGKIHETVRTITKQVLVKVPTDAGCDLNADVVRLLNAARKPMSDTASPPSDPAP